MTKPKAQPAQGAEAKPAAPKAQKFNLAEMRNARFVGFARPLLNRAAELVLGYVPADVIPDDEVVASICKQLNLPAPRAGGPQLPPGERPPAGQASVSPVALKLGKLGRIPNLSSIGRWEGRWRRVSFGPTGTAADTVTLGWDGAQRWPILVPDVVDLPWPYWCRVRDSVHVDTLSDKARKWRRNEETEQLETIVKVDAKTGLPGIRRPVYNYQDMGDVPGTEHLPTGYFEYFLDEAQKTEVFKGFGRQSLIMIYSKLRDAPSSTLFEKKEPTEIRLMIANVLGPAAVNMLNTEIYGAEEA